LEQNPAVNLLYAELSRMVAIPSISPKGFSFIKKKSGSRDYWHLQLAIGAKRYHQYIGPDIEENRNQIEALQSRWKEDEATLEERKKLVAMLRAAKAPMVDINVGRIIEVLEQTNVFRLGAVLVGSHAFAAFQNVLGVIWPPAATMTQDIDLAKDKIDVGINCRLDDTLNQLGFIPKPCFFTGKASPTFTLRNATISIDVLTPKTGNREDDVFIKNLNTHAQPVRFLDYLIESPMQAVMLYGAGILVNLPNPARFAIHKLVVMERRKTSEAIKKRKDLDQAHYLIDFLLKHQEGDLINALEAARSMGPRFRAQLEKGIGKSKHKEPLLGIYHSLGT